MCEARCDSGNEATGIVPFGFRVALTAACPSSVGSTSSFTFSASVGRSISTRPRKRSDPDFDLVAALALLPLALSGLPWIPTPGRFRFSSTSSIGSCSPAMTSAAASSSAALRVSILR